MAVGAAGATRIITAVAQIVMNTVDFGLKMDAAIEQLRIFNFTSGGKAGNLLYENGITPSTIAVLGLVGHKTEGRDKSGYFGTAQGILFDVDNGSCTAGRIPGASGSRSATRPEEEIHYPCGRGGGIPLPFRC